MKKIAIQYCSDLHLEFPENEIFLRDNPITPKAEVLLLAGDIVPFRIMDRYDWFWDKISTDFKQVYWVPGNHEYYNNNIQDYQGVLNREIRFNINLVNNISVIHQDVRFICSTLWSRIRPENEWIIERQLNDFYKIRSGDSVFTAAYYNTLHNESVKFISSELEKQYKGKTVICTHHIPTLLNYPEIYKGDTLNEAFATELSYIIEDLQPDAWVYGHHHYNGTSFAIGETQMVTNQLGYVIKNENYLFNREATIEL